MCKLNKKSGLKRIDPCMKILIKNINLLSPYWKTVACCCGHGKYPMTILMKLIRGNGVCDVVSDKIIPRKKKFYKKDKDGFYYIPEVVS